MRDKYREAYERAVREGKAAPIPPNQSDEEFRERTRRLLKIGLEESGLTDRTRTKGGETRAQFVKRLLDRAQAIAEGYEFVEVRKPKGAEDVCWKELNDPPEGGLANTYLANEKYISIHIGFYEGERQPDGMRIVESDGVDIWIGLYEDVNV